jgi:hypothetical protein
MILPQDAIDELKTIYKRDTGVDLTNEEAYDLGNRLLRLFSVICRKELPSDEEDGRMA